MQNRTPKVHPWDLGSWGGGWRKRDVFFPSPMQNLVIFSSKRKKFKPLKAVKNEKVQSQLVISVVAMQLNFYLFSICVSTFATPTFASL